MQCKHCGHELGENDKFCRNCGAKVEEDIVLEKKTIAQPDIEPVDDTQWYYVKNQESVGPFSTAEITSFIRSGEVNEDTYVWKDGMAEWLQIKYTEFNTVASQPQPEPETSSEEPVWYYVAGNNGQSGPYTESQMEESMRSNAINGETYVWRDGMADWIQLKNSVLAPKLNRYSPAVQSVPNNGPKAATGTGFVTERSIATAIILSIVTCGIYEYYWLYCIVKDANELSREQNQFEGLTDPGMVILLSLVTCGIYLIYYMYKVSKQLSNLRFANGYKVEDNSIICLVLSIFGLAMVSVAIIQNTINDAVKHGC